jgi:hypothetical protein
VAAARVEVLVGGHAVFKWANGRLVTAHGAPDAGPWVIPFATVQR